ncbi:hypothetical protein [Caulobacter hibisci]|uniref:EF-hand domain-containing protein n=1 Tax=Caulobacter hibisci TaxID=2035993 RepID=A0ABS0T4D3_9CAUL|nr:hypothetical protein [Caulobacter hibisci]MBI1686727.1 hypothetical protein [Caulobacter hibisci]
MIRLALVALPLLLAAPAMAQAPTAAPAPQKLVLNLADRDGDGVVSEAEAADRLANADASAEAFPASQPTTIAKRVPIDSMLFSFMPPRERDETGFPALAMKRRFVEPSEFEQALEYRFQEELRERRKNR